MGLQRGQLVTAVGSNVESVRSSTLGPGRDQAVERFNNPDSDCQIFVPSMNPSAFGLNMHRCYSRGIIAQLHWNIGPVCFLCFFPLWRIV
jgi:hypothetical protein